MGIVTSRAFKAVAMCVALIGAVFVLLFSTPAPAHDKPRAQWNPASVNETIQPGQTRTIPVTLTADKNLPNTVVQISPEIASYVSVSPTTIGKTRKGTTVSLTLTVSIPIDALPTTMSGVIELQKVRQEHARDDQEDGQERDGKEEQEKKIGAPLPVSLNVVWAEASYGHVSLTYPPNLDVVNKVDHIAFGHASDVGLPALFAIVEIKLSDNLSQLPKQDSLSLIANLSLEPEDIISMSYHHGGLEVNARTFTRHHFYFYDPATNTALEFLSSNDDFFTSLVFEAILKTLKF